MGLRSRLGAAEVEGFVEFSFSEPSASKVIRCVMSLEKKSSTLYTGGAQRDAQEVRINDAPRQVLTKYLRHPYALRVAPGYPSESPPRGSSYPSRSERSSWETRAST